MGREGDALEDVRRSHRRSLIALGRYRRLVDYVAAAALYLSDNVLLEDPLRPEHLKPRLQGHWELVPGRNAAFAHLNRLSREHELKLVFIRGPAADAVSTPANLWADGTLAELDPRWSRDRAGLERLVREFSWPPPFSARPEAELGLDHPMTYALHVAAQDPDFLVTALVAADALDSDAWHVNDLLDPERDGVVLPILHVSEEADYDAAPLAARFYAEGFAPRVVAAGMQFEAQFLSALEAALDEIRSLRADHPAEARWPVVIMVVPPGLGVAPELKHELFEPADRDPDRLPGADAAENPASLRAIERWLRSYRVGELIDERGAPKADIQALCPSGDRRLGLQILAAARRLAP